MEQLIRLYKREKNIIIASAKYRNIAHIVLDIEGILIRIEDTKIAIRNLEKQEVIINGKKLYSEDYKGNVVNGDVIRVGKYIISLFEEEIEIVCGTEDLVYSWLHEKNPERQKFNNFPIYKRSPRIVYRIEEQKIEIKRPPEKKALSKESIIQMLLPSICTVGFTVIMGVVLKRGAFIYMSIGMTIITMAFSVKKFVDQRRETKAFNKERTEKYKEYLLRTKKKIEEERRKEEEAYVYRAPDNSRISRMIDEYNCRLYERNPYDADFLEVCLGHSRKFSQITVNCNIDEIDMSKDGLLDIARGIARDYDKPDIFPIFVNLKKAHLGLVGERRNIREMLKSLMYQLTFFHSYHDLQIIMLYEKSDSENYDYMRWYPHLRIRALNFVAMISDEQMVDQIMGSIQQILKERANRLEEEKKDTLFLPHFLFVMDSPRLITNHAIMEYLQKEGEALGFSIIYTSDKQENLPENIKTICLLNNSQEATLLLNEGERLNKKILSSRNDDIDFARDARKIAAIIHEQGISSKIPESISFFDMYGINNPKELNVLSRWENNQSHKSLAVPLGLRAEDDIVKLNLHEKAHGPHGLVAGTTGSGKSEIIQSYILSLAVNFHPNEVGFLLIDYKGGGMANLFSKLPHLLGTITNLDKSESMRALISIKSELARRQRIFGENGVNHINGYNLLFREGKVIEPIPHLFIISDEFAELKKEQPEFMSELVSAARIGRSLGVHLILATQKPSGVVDDQIWTNSRFKLCLKVQGTADSNEMLHTPDAANIVNPGRAYLQVGNNEIYELFQSAWSGELYSDEKENEKKEDDRVYLINKLGQGELINQDLSGQRGKLTSKETQLDVTVSYLNELYQKELALHKVIEVRKPWLPPLKEQLVNPKLITNMSETIDLSVGIGLIDMPEEQIQREYRINLMQEGNTVYIASGGYGKSVFLTNAMLELASKNTVDNVNFYILDFGNNALMPLAGMPHCSAHIMLDETEKFSKFCTIIEEEIRYRKKLFAATLVQNYEMYISTQRQPLRAIVILIDNYDAIREMGFDIEEFFTRVTRDGVSLGIYTISTAGRLNAIRAAALNNYKNKIAGVNFDENEVRMIVGRSKYVLPDIKGRAMVKTGENVNIMQLYTPVESSDSISYINNIRSVMAEIKATCGDKEAKHIPILPEELNASMLQKFGVGKEADIYVGLEASKVERIGFNYSNTPFLVLGDATSGKTNVLRNILSQIKGADVVIIDSRNRGLEMYRSSTRYICTLEEMEDYANDLSAIMTERENNIKCSMENGMSYTDAMDALTKQVIVIDDLTNMASVAGVSINIIAARIKKAIQLGFLVVVSENLSNFKGQDELTRELKATKDGLLLSDQGYLNIFPIKPSEAPRKPDAIFMQNGTAIRVRLPIAD